MGLTRRGFIQGAAAGVPAAAALARGEAGAADAAPLPAIDTHTHFFDPTRPQGVPWPKKSDPLCKPHLPPDFLPLAESCNVVGTVVVEASPWLEDNQWVLDLAKANPAIVGFIGNLKLGRPEFAAELERFGANPLFRGLRLNGRAVAQGLGQRAFEDDLRRLAKRKLTLELLGGPALAPVAPRLAKLAPELRLVIDHLPFPEWDADLKAARRALTEVAKLPNVYAKVSHVLRRVDGRAIENPEVYRPRLDLLWELFGADRVIFGSNWPVSNRLGPYASVHQVVADYVGAKGRAAAEKYFWKNSLAAYSWRPRGKAAKLVRQK